MKSLFVINGSPTSGKDEFISLLGKYLNVKNISSVDTVKKAAQVLGWNGKKEDKDRKFLSDLKMLSVNYNDHPYKYVRSEIDKFNLDTNQIMFIHIREPDEISRIVQEFQACTILIDNPRVDVNKSNISDASVNDIKYDFVISNDGSLQDLELKAKLFSEFLKQINIMRE